MKMLTIIIFLTTTSVFAETWKVRFMCQGQGQEIKVSMKGDELKYKNLKDECAKDFKDALKSILVAEGVANVDKVLSSVKIKSPLNKYFDLPPESEARNLYMSKVDDVINNQAPCTDLIGVVFPGQLNIMARYPGVFSEAVDKLIENKSPCLPNLPTSYGNMLVQKSPENMQEVVAHCEQNESDPLCKQVKENRLLFDKNIRKLVSALRGQTGKKWMEENDCSEEPFKDLDDILKRIDKYQDELNCAPMEVGVSRIAYDRQDKPAYRLTQTGPNSFEAAVGMIIPGPAVEGVTPEMMFERVQKCLNEASPYLAGKGMPDLKVKIMGHDDANKSEVPIHKVTIKSSALDPDGMRRDTQLEYRSNIECSTITHEVMHLLGMPDDYPTGGNGNCQILPPCNLMGQGRQVAGRTGSFVGHVPEVMECECRKDGKGGDCLKVFSGNDESLKKHFGKPSSHSIQPEGSMKCENKSKSLNWKTLADKENRKKTEIVEESESVFSIRTDSFGHNSDETSEVIQTCRCSSQDLKCLELLKKKISAWKQDLKNRTELPGSCPSGMTKVGLRVVSKEPHPSHGLSVVNGNLRIHTKPIYDSGLLLPNQVAMITGTLCPTKGEKYQICMNWGFYNDGDERRDFPEYIKAVGKPCEKDKSTGCVKLDCSKRPAFCKDDEAFMKYE